MKHLSLEDRTRDFTMALRESLMNYYKGSCVDRFSNLSTHHLCRSDISPPSRRNGRRLYNYERRELEMRQPKRYQLTWDDTVLLEVRKEPHEVTLFTDVFARSPELQTVEQQLRPFFKTYLPRVQLIEKQSRASDSNSGSSDKKYITPRKRQVALHEAEPDQYPYLEQMRVYPGGIVTTMSTDTWAGEPIPWGLHPSRFSVFYEEEI